LDFLRFYTHDDEVLRPVGDNEFRNTTYNNNNNNITFGVDFFFFSYSSPALDTYTLLLTPLYGGSAAVQYTTYVSTRWLENPAVVITTTTELHSSVGGVLRSFSAVVSHPVPPHIVPQRRRQRPESELQRTVFKRDECIIMYIVHVANDCVCNCIRRIRMLYYITGWLFWHLDSKHSLYLEKVLTFLKIFFNVWIRFDKQHISYWKKNVFFNITWNLNVKWISNDYNEL